MKTWNSKKDILVDIGAAISANSDYPDLQESLQELHNEVFTTPKKFFDGELARANYDHYCAHIDRLVRIQEHDNMSDLSQHEIYQGEYDWSDYL